MSLNPFPGPQPYRAADRSRFYGREEMTGTLTSRVLAHRLVTVFGPSGSGKSSLMQAAVIPRLMEEHAFRAAHVDSWPEGVPAARWLADAMFDGFKLGARPEGMAPLEMVLSAAERAVRRSERPFLVYLDQLEQLLYDSRDPADVDAFAACLQELAELPIQGFKLVLSLREDYLGRFRDRLQGRLRLLDEGFRVGPLRVGQLSEAMRKVAATGDPPQPWSLEETRGLMMQVRTPGQAATDEAEAQAAYAQIVCRALWDQRDVEGERAVPSFTFDVEVILEQYLEATLGALGDLREDARRLLEEHLITADGSRTLRTEKELLEELTPEALATILRHLEGAAILRAEEHQGRRYFELGHDWLAKKVLARVQKRAREAEEHARARQREAEEQERERQRALEARARELERQAEEQKREQARKDMERSLKRARGWVRVLAFVASVVAVAALLLSLPVIDSFLNNRAFNKETEAYIDETRSIDWSDSRPFSDKLAKLNRLRGRLMELELYRREGAPSRLSWGMYDGDELEQRVRAAYAEVIQAGFVLTAQQRLSARLRAMKGDDYLAKRDLLRAYLVLSDADLLGVKEEGPEKVPPDDGAAVAALTEAWVEALSKGADYAGADLRGRLRPHAASYIELLRSRRVALPPPDEELVSAARKALAAVPIRERYFAIFVGSLLHEKHDASGPESRENLRYPPVTLTQVFSDQPEVLNFLKSAHAQKWGTQREVAGPFTEKGHERVQKNLAEAAELLKQDGQVVPLGGEDSGERLRENLENLKEDYERRYIEQWTDWMSDIHVSPPMTPSEAIDLYGVLTYLTPYRRIAHTLEDHTQWPRSASDRESGDRGKSAVPSAFRRTVQVGVSSEGTDTPLSQYLSLLRQVRDELFPVLPDPSPLTFSARRQQAAQAAKALLAPFDDRARKLWTPLFLNPLAVADAPPP
jgi:hypothetical protein